MYMDELESTVAINTKIEGKYEHMLNNCVRTSRVKA